MNDFSRASNLLFSILYADDTNIFIEGTEYHKVISTLNTELLKVSDWLNSNKLTINLKKTHYMVFHRSRIKTNSSNLVILKETLVITRSTQFLGVIIYNKLKWTDHITYIKKKISKAIGIIHRARTFLDNITLKNLYHSIVFPYLIYCTEIWGNAATIHFNPIIILQKKRIRAITFSHYLSPSKPLFDSLDILKFESLVIQRISLLMYKYSRGLFPHQYLVFLRKAMKFILILYIFICISLCTPRGKSKERYTTFSFKGVHIWNHISSNVNTCVSYSAFKKLVKIYLQTSDVSSLR